MSISQYLCLPTRAGSLRATYIPGLIPTAKNFLNSRRRCCIANTKTLVEGGSYVFAFVLARLLIRTKKPQAMEYSMSMVYVERV